MLSIQNNMKPLKALIIEDSMNDAALLLRYLRNKGYEVRSEIVQTAADMKNALASDEWQIVLSDYMMPSFTGLDALAILEESGLDIPIIIISGTIGEEVAVEAMLKGVNDYLIKGNLARLAPAIEREVENALERRRQRQSEENLYLSEASLAHAQRIAHIGSWDWNISNNQLRWSDETYRIFDRSKDDFEGTYEAFLDLIHPEDKQVVQSAVNAAISKIAPYNVEHRIILPNGDEKFLCEMGEVTFDESDQPIQFTGTVQDITERLKAEESVRFQAHLLDTVEQAVIATDLGGIVTYWNQFAEKLYGWKNYETIGRNITELTAPENSRFSAEEVTAQLSAGKSRSDEFIVKNKAGKHFSAYVNNSPVTDSEGKLIGIVGISIDITERKRAERQLLESEEKYRSIVETANEGIWLTDLETRATYVNRQMAEMLGYTVEEMMGRQVFDFVFEEDIPDAEWKYEQRLNGQPESGEFRMRRKDGSEIITLYNTTPRIDENGKIVGFLSMRSDITERKKAEKELKYAESKYRNLIESSPAIVYLAEPYPPFSPIYVSPNVTAFGHSIEEWFNRSDMWLSLIHKDDRERVLNATIDAIEHEKETDLEYRVVTREGVTLWLHDKGFFVLDEQGNKTGWQGVMLDITKTKELQEQLRQSQKLESVGRLAGGIAHDFNNMLTAINGYSELTLRKLEADNPLRRNIEEIKKAGERSALLTRQLLAFSRQQILQPVVLDLNEVITDTIKLLERLIGEDIELLTKLDPKIGRVNVDLGQLSQIIVNLAVNARDAMPHGGRLTIETANFSLKPDVAEDKINLLPGEYVILTVSDTGSGIDESIQPHIFEPFFTTKAVGQGTGLGLATVYGIVIQSGGAIEVDSREKIGTIFRIYLPRVREEAASEPEESFPESTTGTETILLVEDEELVRNLSRKILESCGYTVIEARDGMAALEICKKGEYSFDLLMTDVVMPQMGGQELAEKLTGMIPNLKILFTSGYTDDAEGRYGVIEASNNFIQKPFTFDGLTLKVRELLDNRDGYVDSRK